MSDTWLTEVIVDSRIVDEGDGFAHTETEQVAVLVRDGLVAEITTSAPAGASALSGDGLLLLPGLRDLHIHLDKVYYGGPWRAPAVVGSLAERIAQEIDLLPELVSHLEERALAIVALAASNGTTRLRAHTNVDHVVGAESVRRLAALAQGFAARMDCEIVAFPQHSLRAGDVVPLMREALASGAGIVGGIDPARTEQDVDSALETTFGLATEFDAPVDIHLHDPGHLGVFEIERIAAFTREAGWHGRVTVSHAYALAQVDEVTVAHTAEVMAEAAIAITTALRLDAAIPVPTLRRHGVEVFVGTDSVSDHWDPFGQADMLEKVSLIAQRFGWSDERSLAAAIELATGLAVFDHSGKRSWLTVGMPADFVLVDASCAAEAVARRAPRRRLFKGGAEMTSDGR